MANNTVHTKVKIASILNEPTKAVSLKDSIHRAWNWVSHRNDENNKVDNRFFYEQERLKNQLERARRIYEQRPPLL